MVVFYLFLQKWSSWVALTSFFMFFLRRLIWQVDLYTSQGFRFGALAFHVEIFCVDFHVFM